MPTVTLIGPQRLRPTLIDVIRSLNVRGPVATITAGWEDREPEDAELRDHLEGRAVNLRLWARTEEVFAKDPELLAGLRTRKERLARIQALYSIRLRHAMSAAQELSRHDEPHEILDPEVDEAIDAVRRLDEHHLSRIRDVFEEFDDRYRPSERDELAWHRAEVARELEQCTALCVAGGHVGVLLTRLQLFDVLSLVGLRPVVAWSAGAMALGERIVLFHDAPPQGFGHAEVYAPGMAAYRKLLLFPHARRRLLLEDRARVSLLQRRFQPATCIPMDEADRVDWRGNYVDLSTGTRTLTRAGAIAREGAA